MNAVFLASLLSNVFLGFLAFYFFDLSKRYRAALSQERTKRFQLLAIAAVIIGGNYIRSYLKNKCTKS